MQRIPCCQWQKCLSYLRILGKSHCWAQLPDPVNVVAKRVFCYPKVCSTCQESQPDRLKGTDYDPSLDCSRTRLPSLGCKDCDSRDRVIQYSVHQKPYHMYFSSSEYVEPDFVVTYGIPHKKDDVHNEISYRNMTHSYGSVLVLMDSTKDLLTQAVKDVKAAQPTSVVLLSPERNTCRGFGSHLSMFEFSANAPNLKYYMAGLYRPKRADESSSEKTLVGCPIIPL